jgi:hypothetical protein
MSNGLTYGLTLPFFKSGDTSTLCGTDEAAFQITLTSGGGTALACAAYGAGTDEFGDPCTGLSAATDVGWAVQAN